MDCRSPAPAPYDLRLDGRRGSVTTDNPAPVFAWRLPEGPPAEACEITLLSEGGERIWTGTAASPAPICEVRYDGPALTACTRYAWQVRCWRHDTPDEWSATAAFETGMLDAAAWQAQWIGGMPGARAATYLRGIVNLPAGIVSARAYVSALGWYRFFANGHDKTGDAQVPRWTPFDHIIEYQTYDVTADLRPGVNILAMAIGDGRFRGRTGIADKRAIYGDTLAGIVQLRLACADGRVQWFGSDAGWHAGTGRVLQSDPKRGEQVDLRIPDDDWLCAPQPPRRFRPARPVTPPAYALVAEEVERVDAIRRLEAKRIWRAPSGKLLVDFGQNLAGVVRLRIDEPAGTCVTLRFSEVIGRDGELDTRYLMGKVPGDPPPTDRIVSGGRPAWRQPWFTIHGFRYVEVDGLSGDPAARDFEAVVLSTDLAYTGRFVCSDERLNRLVDNVRWSMMSNFVDTPTDCPTRERSGWTGDIQIFAETAIMLANVQPYLRRYLRNLALDQRADGAVPPYIPTDATRHAGKAPLIVRDTADSAGWGDAAVMVPFALYRHYGDRDVLVRQYDSMRRWIDHLASLARRSPGRGRLFPRRLPDGLGRFVVDSGFHWGEWLRPGEDMIVTSIKHRLTAPAEVATAYLAHSAGLMADIARTLGRNEDAEIYAGLSARVRQAWCAAFVRDSGARIGRDRQDDYVRALAFDLLPESQRAAAAARLAALIAANRYRLGTGFLSTPLLLPVLVRFGRSDLAYRLLLQDESPSWLFQVERGATTTWESWEGYDRHGNARYSHNHYAFGAVVAWLFSGVAGITPLDPGYRRIRFAPVIGGGLTHASGEFDTPFGRVSSGWRRKGGEVELHVVVPPGATGEVHFPDGHVETVDAGRATFTWAADPAEAHDLPEGHSPPVRRRSGAGIAGILLIGGIAAGALFLTRRPSSSAPPRKQEHKR